MTEDSTPCSCWLDGFAGVNIDPNCTIHGKSSDSLRKQETCMLSEADIRVYLHDVCCPRCGRLPWEHAQSHADNAPGAPDTAY